MQDNIRISIESDLEYLLNRSDIGGFYVGLSDILGKLEKHLLFHEYLINLKKQEKSWKVTIGTNHRKSDNDFRAKLGKLERKRLISTQSKGDMNKIWFIWKMLADYKDVADKPIKTLTKRGAQKAWDFNQRKWDYLEVIGEKDKSNDNINEFERDQRKYRRAIKVIVEDFLSFMDRKNNILEFMGATYDFSAGIITYGKKKKHISPDDQRIKFFKIMAQSRRGIGYKEICQYCLPEETLISMKGAETDIEYSDQAKSIKLRFCKLLEELGCKKEIIDKKLMSNKGTGYVFNLK